MIQNLLKQVPGFDALENNSLENISSTFYRRSFKQGQILQDQGRDIKTVGLLSSGAADHMIKTANGDESIKTIGAAEFFGATDYFISGSAITCLKANRPGVFFFQHINDFKTMIHRYPFIQNFFYKTALSSVQWLWKASSDSTGRHLTAAIRFPDNGQDPGQDNDPVRSLEIALAFIDKHYRKPIGIEDLARQCHMSKWYFSRIFKSTMGISFSNYLNARRVEAAKALMNNPDLNVTDICFHVGFNDLSYFSKVFHKSEGMLPSHYRNHIKMMDRRHYRMSL